MSRFCDGCKARHKQRHTNTHKEEQGNILYIIGLEYVCSVVAIAAANDVAIG